MGFEVSKDSGNLVSLLQFLFVSRHEFSVAASCACSLLPATSAPPPWPPFQNHNLTDNLFVLSVTFVMVFYNSNRKVTNTHWKQHCEGQRKRVCLKKSNFISFIEPSFLYIQVNLIKYKEMQVTLDDISLSCSIFQTSV